MDGARPRPSSNLRCAVCHGDALEAEACAGCGTLAHPDCAERCPTLGCARSAAKRRWDR